MIMEGQNQAERESVYAKVKIEDSNLYKTLLVNRNFVYMYRSAEE